MSHPPIPPNCACFVEHTFHIHIDSLATRFVPIENANAHYERPLIAAVACYFWDREQDRRMKELDVYEDHDSCLTWDGFKYDGTKEERDKTYLEMCRRTALVHECAENIRLWKLWGDACTTPS